MTNIFYGLLVVLGTLGGLTIGPSFVARPVADGVARPSPPPIDRTAPMSIKQTEQLLKDLHASMEASSRSVDAAAATIPARRRAAWIGAGLGLAVSGIAVTLLSRRSAEDSKRSAVRREGPALKLG